MNEEIKTLFKTRLKYQYNNNRKNIMCKNLYLLVYKFAVWESDAKNYSLMLLLKRSRDFVM